MIRVYITLDFIQLMSSYTKSKHDSYQLKETIHLISCLGSLLLNTAFMLLGSTKILSIESTYPRKTTLSNKNPYLKKLAQHYLSFNLCNINLRCCVCFSRILEYTKMSYVNTMMNLSRQSWNTLIIRSINIVRALVTSNGIASNS